MWPALVAGALQVAWDLFTKKRNKTPSSVKEVVEFAERVVRGEEPVTPEERMALIQHWSVVEQAWSQAFQASQTTEQVQLQSEDNFTRRARPSRIYAAVLVVLFANVIYPLVTMALACFGKTTWDFVSILDIPWYIYAVFLGDFATYAFVRSKYDKRGLKAPSLFGSLVQTLKGG